MVWCVGSQIKRIETSLSLESWICFTVTLILLYDGIKLTLWKDTIHTYLYNMLATYPPWLVVFLRFLYSKVNFCFPSLCILYTLEGSPYTPSTPKKEELCFPSLRTLSTETNVGLKPTYWGIMTQAESENQALNLLSHPGGPLIIS